jgi:hypothetical protein
MYALIYDDHSLDQSEKKVISVHETRQESETALSLRQKSLGKKVYDCNTRVVWTDKDVSSDDVLNIKDFSTWRPGEDIPEGELHSDSD